MENIQIDSGADKRGFSHPILILLIIVFLGFGGFLSYVFIHNPTAYLEKQNYLGQALQIEENLYISGNISAFNAQKINIPIPPYVSSCATNKSVPHSSAKENTIIFSVPLGVDNIVLDDQLKSFIEKAYEEKMVYWIFDQKKKEYSLYFNSQDRSTWECVVESISWKEKK